MMKPLGLSRPHNIAAAPDVLDILDRRPLVNVDQDGYFSGGIKTSRHNVGGGVVMAESFVPSAPKYLLN